MINANDDANDVVLQQSDTVAGWTEIVIDGVVTEIFEMSALDGLVINLGGGNDTITIDNAITQFATDLGFTINGGGGFDVLEYENDALGHQFDITGSGSGTIDGINTFSGLEEISGTDGDDVFTSMNSFSDWVLSGGAGNDVFDISNSSTGAYSLDGGTGDDSYRLPLANFASVEIVDSIDDEADSLVGLGTNFDDTVTVNNDVLTFNGNDVSVFGLFDGIEQLDFDGLDGDDTFNIEAIANDLAITGSNGNDTFNISSAQAFDSGSTLSILGTLSIDGGDGSNRLIVGNAEGAESTTIVTDDNILATAVDVDAPILPLSIDYTGNFGTAADGTPGILLIGSSGSDNFDIRQMLESNSILVSGGDNADTFNVRPNTAGDVYLDGGEGADTYRTTFAISNDHVVNVIDSGDDDARDRFSVRVTEGADEFNIGSLGLNADRNFLSWNSNLENLVVDTLGGDDIATVRSNAVPFLRITLGDGNDTGIVEGTLGISTVKFQGQAGNDSFDFQDSVAASFVQALGGDGDDSFVVGATSFARSRVDGQTGNDSANVFFAARDNRRVNARDTGGGFDSLLVTGTMAADRVDLRNKLISREGEFVTYDENTENFDMELLGSNDVLNIFGTSVLEFNANLGVGNDTVNVFSTSTPNETVAFNVSLSSGNDTANVFRLAENATVALFGQTGNDNFNVGSNSADDTGNLSRIRGTLFLQGGSNTAGLDTLQVNDFAAVASFAYSITDSIFSHDAFNSANDRAFESFGYGGIEFIFAYGTDRNNTFSVIPSATTVIRVDGNGGTDDLRIISQEDREFFGSADEGFIEFSQSSQNVSYIELEDLSDAQI